MKPLLKVLFFLLISLFSGNVFSQQCFDEISDQKIPFESLSQSTDSIDSGNFLRNLYCFIGEDLDSIDIEILSQSEFLGIIMIKGIGSGDEELTYGRLKQLMIDATKGPEYSKMRDLHLLTRDFSRLPAIYDNWDLDRQALLELGVPEQKLEPFGNYLKTHSDSTKTYEQLLKEFELSKTNTKTAEEEIESPSLQHQLDDLIENKGVLDMDSLIQRSKLEGKPVLLYFTGYNVVNARKLELVVLRNKSIIQSLQDDFIFLAVYVDARRELPQEQWTYSETLQRTIKTSGDCNLKQQMELSNTASQPYFIGLTSKKETIGTGGYVDFKSTESFLTFLKKVKLEFEK